MKYVLLTLIILFMFNIDTVSAHGDHAEETNAGRALIQSAVPCEKLSDGQLEDIGEYFMEQMHPGSQHELMDNMMGGEGSESLRQAHISMARRWYCGDAAGIGMMASMMGSDMMDGSGVGSEYLSNSFGMMGGGMFAGMMGSLAGNGFMGMAAYFLVWIFLLVGLAAFIKYLLKK